MNTEEKMDLILRWGKEHNDTRPGGEPEFNAGWLLHRRIKYKSMDEAEKLQTSKSVQKLWYHPDFCFNVRWRRRRLLYNEPRTEEETTDYVVINGKRVLFDEVVCKVCEKDEQNQCVLLCDGCGDAYHTYCVGLSRVPKDDWYCGECDNI